MRSHDILRRTLERDARTSIGINPDAPRQFLSQSQAAPLDAQIARLPVNTVDLEALRNYATGNWLFMVGVSEVGGSDEIA